MPTPQFWSYTVQTSYKLEGSRVPYALGNCFAGVTASIDEPLDRLGDEQLDRLVVYLSPPKVHVHILVAVLVPRCLSTGCSIHCCFNHSCLGRFPLIQTSGVSTVNGGSMCLLIPMRIHWKSLVDVVHGWMYPLTVRLLALRLVLPKLNMVCLFVYIILV